MKQALNYCLIITVAFTIGWVSHTKYSTNLEQQSIKIIDTTLLTKNLPLTTNIKNNIPTVNTPTVDIANIFNQMLEEKSYKKAISLYNNSASNNDNDNDNKKDIHSLYTILTHHIQTLITEKAYNDAEELIRLYLYSFPRDLFIWRLLSDIQITQGYYIEALLNFYQARNNAMSLEEFDHITATSREVIKKIDTLLTEEGKTFELIDLYREFITIDENSADLTYRLAELHIKVNQVKIATSLLTTITTDLAVGEPAKKLLADITRDTTSNTHTAIPLLRFGEHYVVEAYINNQQPINLMIDTGATFSTLTQTHFDNLQQLTYFIFIDTVLINTASGPVKATRYQVPVFSIEDYVLSNIDFVVMPYESGKNIDGLLGMNVLSKFDFTIDQQQALLYLKPRKDSKVEL